MIEHLLAKLECEVISLQENALAELGILAVVIGGSTVYNSTQDFTQYASRDIDGAILVSSIEDIRNILDHHRSRLKHLLRISEEERLEVVLPPSRSSAWSSIDAVRFSGFANDSRKTSFKLISLEHFRGPRRCMNILSLKNKRVYRGFTFDGTPAYQLQQTTRLDSNWTILHDPWLYEGQRRTLAFGVTTDLLLTGCWLRDSCAVGVRIRNEIMDYATNKLGSKIERICFARSDKFDPPFQTWLQAQYHAEFGVIVNEAHSVIDSALDKYLVLFGPAAKPDFAAKLDREESHRMIRNDSAHCEVDYEGRAPEETNGNDTIPS